MMMPSMMGEFAGMGLTSLVWKIVLGLIVWAIVTAVRRSAESSGQVGSAINILKNSTPAVR